MKKLLRLVLVLSILVSVQAVASTTFFKVLEQGSDGTTSHRAFDRSSIGDGIDPVLQLILLDAPVDPGAAQLLWEASEKPIPWGRQSEERAYRMIEYALLPPGSILQYRIHSHETGDEFTSLRHTRSAQDQDYAIDASIIDALPDGIYDVHVRMSVPFRAIQVLKQRIEVSESGAVADDEENLENEAPDTPVIVPGEGFDEDTEQPDAIGDLTTNTMARWDVVPFQEFKDVFEVGIVAHHSYGMDRVVVSFNGGPWRSIESPSLNPRTKVNEYWAKIDAKDVQDGKVELRAIAYPKDGTPHVLEPLFLWANSGGSINFPVHYIKPGDTEVPRDLECPTDRWLTVKYAPGASQRVSFVTRTAGNIKLEGLNMKGNVGGWNGPGSKGMVWFDGVDYLGVESSRTPGKKLDELTTMWPVDYNWRQAYYTDFVVDHVANPLNANHGIARNVHIKTAYEDAIRVYGLVTNVKVDKLVRGAPSGKWGYVHSDMFQLSNELRNGIYQNIVGTDIKGQGLSGGGHYDCAFVNIDVTVNTSNIGLRLFGDQHNVLYEDVNIKSPLGGQVVSKPFPFDGKDVVLREVNPMPNGWQREGIKLERLVD